MVFNHSPEITGGAHWDYPPPPALPFIYGDAVTYAKPMAWLAANGCTTIEDWGAGCAVASLFTPPGVAYRAIDFAPSSAPYVDEVADLHDYHPDPLPDGILLRHVLEHCLDWQPVLRNAVSSFSRCMVLVLFTPLAETTHRLVEHWEVDWSFARADLEPYFAGLDVASEYQASLTQYGGETIFYLKRAMAGACNA